MARHFVILCFLFPLVFWVSNAGAQESSASFANGGIKIGYDNRACSAAIEGAIRYDSSTKCMGFCNGTAWTPTCEPDTCKKILDAGDSTGNGVYSLPDGNDVYCDMTTDSGGWTLVASIKTNVLEDKAGSYHADLQTLNPTGTTANHIWDGLRRKTEGDIRFVCKLDVTTGTLDVDLSFYSVNWYQTLTEFTDQTQVCFNTSGQPISPARRDNVAASSLAVGNLWNHDGEFEGEDNCSDNGDFTVDFDDRGMDGTSESESTDWGADDNVKKCGSSGPGGASAGWFIFVR